MCFNKKGSYLVFGFMYNAFSSRISIECLLTEYPISSKKEALSRFSKALRYEEMSALYDSISRKWIKVSINHVYNDKLCSMLNEKGVHPVNNKIYPVSNIEL